MPLDYGTKYIVEISPEKLDIHLSMLNSELSGVGRIYDWDDSRVYVRVFIGFNRLAESILTNLGFRFSLA